jgi:DNA polymerase
VTRPPAPAPAPRPAPAQAAPAPPTISARPTLDLSTITTLDELRTLALACTRCAHLAAARTQVVFGVGNPRAELLFVGEAPGADEDAQGEPFVGKAGQLLTKIIQTMGYQRDQVYIANILKCRPDTRMETARRARTRCPSARRICRNKLS